MRLLDYEQLRWMAQVIVFQMLCACQNKAGEEMRAKNVRK